MSPTSEKSSDRKTGQLFFVLKKLGIISLRKTFFASLNYKKSIGIFFSYYVSLDKLVLDTARVIYIHQKSI